MLIASRNNEIIKRARCLSTRKGRAEQGLHLIEGEKVLTEALHAGAAVREVFVEEGHVWPEPQDARVYTVTRSVMESLCDTVTPQWVCATVETPACDLPETFPVGMIVALERVQDPGNLGTIVRTADAMGAAGVLLSDGCADPYAPKTLRAAMGSTYHLPIWRGDIIKALQCLRKSGFVCICGHLQGEERLPHPKDRCVIVIGNEGSGVTDETAALCLKYRLKMYGRAESLNASVATGILMYEVAEMMHNTHLGGVMFHGEDKHI